MKKIILLLGCFMFSQAALANSTEVKAVGASDEVKATISQFEQSKRLDQLYFSNAYGFAVFPDVAEGGVGLAGAHGKGEVFVGGEKVGKATLSHLSIGAALGGKTFDQIIFFIDEKAFNEFAAGDYALSADASGVMIESGAQAKTSTAGNTISTDNKHQQGDYVNGMAIFVYPKGGLMLDISIGGQKFDYTPN
ncbi:hypothetical protein [Motilimonas sp. KMU-193]|uniref:lipid-binding SYLF domain-containing protein n=1 Tax=Motilimonas sp. KMU-193 TaxID=3388668 RepID=UPI00396B2D27